MKRVLVAYASKAGSTAEVARAIGEVVAQYGASVDVRSVQEAGDPAGYDAVVVGSPSYNKLMPEAVEFVRKHRAALRHRPAAYFFTGITMIEDTPEHRAKAAWYLEPLCEVKEPVGMGLFAGKIDHTKLPLPWRFMLSWVKEGPMADGDHRDWDAIRAWARQIAPVLLEPGFRPASTSTPELVGAGLQGVAR